MCHQALLGAARGPCTISHSHNPSDKQRILMMGSNRSCFLVVIPTNLALCSRVVDGRNMVKGCTRKVSVLAQSVKTLAQKSVSDEKKTAASHQSHSIQNPMLADQYYRPDISIIV